MIPLWTTTRRPVQSRCGWAFSSVGRPCVAQRVWPRPKSPSIGSARMASSSFAQLARAAPQLNRAVPDHRDARGVVAAVLEAAQAVDEDGDDGFRADVADDAAHRQILVRSQKSEVRSQKSEARSQKSNGVSESAAEAERRDPAPIRSSSPTDLIQDLSSAPDRLGVAEVARRGCRKYRSSSSEP